MTAATKADAKTDKPNDSTQKPKQEQAKKQEQPKPSQDGKKEQQKPSQDGKKEQQKPQQANEQRQADAKGKDVKQQDDKPSEKRVLSGNVVAQDLVIGKGKVAKNGVS